MARKRSKGSPFTIRMSDDVPPDAGYADACALVERGIALEFVFWDSPTGDVLARLVASRDAILERLWGNSKTFYKETKDWLEARGVAPTALTAAKESKLVGVVPRVCNVFRISRSGMDAQLLVYYVAPTEIVDAPRQGRSTLLARPVCQVEMPLPLAVGLLEAIRGEEKS